MTPPTPTPTTTARRPDTALARFEARAGDGPWTPVTHRLSAPAGTTLQFRFRLPIDHEVVWKGAKEVTLGLYRSVAVLNARRAGPHEVRLHVLDLDGRPLESWSVRVEIEATASERAA